MEIHLNLNGIWRKNDRYWTFSIGGGHAALALRGDYQKLAGEVCRDLGFQRLRFHGILNDDMQVVTIFDSLLRVPKARKVKTISFYQVGQVYDALLENGITPFVEIGFMPEALASKKKRVFYYKANVSKPKYDEEWEKLIEEFIRFLVHRYGDKVVETWYFEVWNEPDLKGFFWTGTKEDYFHFYKSTVEAIRRVLPHARVGGPSTSQNRWLREFREYCDKEDLPLSFLSTHHYPGDDIGLPIFTMENVKRLLFTAKNHQGESVHTVFHKMMVRENILPLIRKDSMHKQLVQAHVEAAGVPLYYTEWNVNPTCTHPIHDKCASAAFIVKHVMDGQYLMKGCSFFTFSDIFEENTFFSQPFSGSFGLTTIHGIPKPSYWAFYLLNRLQGYRLYLPLTHEHVEYAVFGEKHTLQVIVYAQEYVQDDRVEEVHLHLTSEWHPVACTYMSVNPEDHDPRNIWEAMGSPMYLQPSQVAEIKRLSRVVERELPFYQNNKGSHVSFTLRTNEVVLITLKMKEDLDEYITKTKEATPDE